MIPSGMLAVASSPTLWTQWFIDPLTAILLLVLLAWYLDGLLRLRARGEQQAPSSARTAAFLLGLGVAALALVSPLDSLGYRLFAAHMVQHLVLIVVAAPLLAWSGAAPALGAALPRRLRQVLSGWRDRLAATITAAQAAWLAAAAFSVTIWLWHVPAAHDAALTQLPLHALEHVTVLLTATVFWRMMLGSSTGRISPGLAAIIVSLISLQGSLLSAILMFSPVSLCASYAGNPLTDQIMAGLLMCIPASLVYAGSTVWALSRLISSRVDHAR